MDASYKSVLTLLVALGIMDAIYLYLRQTYHKNLFYSVQNSPLNVRLFPIPFIYLLLAFAIYYVALKDNKGLGTALARGAAVGFFMYAFYDLTNYATLTNWTVEMMTIDTLWGTLVSAAAAGIAWYVMKKKTA
jgi:uncharacterized membrane protein